MYSVRALHLYNAYVIYIRNNIIMFCIILLKRGMYIHTVYELNVKIIVRTLVLVSP